MSDVSIRDLRNHGGEVVDRVALGEHVIITRSGKPVAELRPLRAAVSVEVLVERRRRLPRLDPRALRRDLDEVLDAQL